MILCYHDVRIPLQRRQLHKCSFCGIFPKITLPFHAEPVATWGASWLRCAYSHGISEGSSWQRSVSFGTMKNSLLQVSTEKSRARKRERERENHTAILKHVSGGGFRIVISPLNLLTSPCATTQWPARQYIRVLRRGRRRAKKICVRVRERRMERAM